MDGIEYGGEVADSRITVLKLKKSLLATVLHYVTYLPDTTSIN